MYSENYQGLTQQTYEESPRWEALCSDGNKYYDDNQIKQSWQKFRDFCKKENIQIKELTIGFRGNIITLPPDKEGYFFRRMERAQLFGDYVMEYFIVGYIENEKINITKYKVPEMLFDEYETRELTEDNLESVI